jgi:hypothetical protein
MLCLKSVKTYVCSFPPKSSDSMPPSYQVYLSAHDGSMPLYVATVIAKNTDSPLPKDAADGGFWSRAFQRSLTDLEDEVNEELKALNDWKEMYRSSEHWLEAKNKT